MAKTRTAKTAKRSVGDSFTAVNVGILNKKRNQFRPRAKKVSWKDEQVIESVVSNASELVDPAILAVREVPKFRYTKEELINLRETPLSRKKPDFINTYAVPVTIWDQEHWNERKKSTTPTDAAPRNDQQQQQPDNRRRPGDPRERIRKENDGIVLSPQRRSFNTGCFVPMREQPQARVGGPRPHSPISNKGDVPHMNMREIQGGGNRRIGSGRILRDSWDFNEKVEGGENDYYRNIQDDRRSFKREFDLSKDIKDRRNSGGRYGGRRISGGEKDEEPEWFSGGPLSQNDTIELRGFEDSEKAGGTTNKKKLSSSQAKRVREWAKKKSSNDDKLEEEPCNEHKPTKPSNAKADNEASANQNSGSTKENVSSTNVSSSGGTENINEHSFLFDDIFKCDTIPGLLTNGAEGTADNNTKSRFSRWFQQQSPEKVTESRRSSLQEEHFLKNLLNDITEPAKVTIPPQLGNSESYFAPISPAAVNASGGEPGTPRPGQINIAEIFQRGKQEQTVGGKNGGDEDILNSIKAQFPGKVMSLNELESRMRKSADISGNHSQSKALPSQEDEMSAFKRLLSQVSGGHAVTANNGSAHQKMPPMTLMEMLSHSQQQEEVQARINHQSQIGASSPKPQPLGVIHNEFILKMQQAQQEQQAQLQRQQHVNMLNKLMGLHSVASAQHLRASPLHDLAQQQSRELLSRPEAQAILQAMHQRIPSPRELQVHTQNILQRALIKKMLEEQQENFRKKQEMQQPGHSPNNTGSTNKNVSSPTPLAFTPTSVLRKMTADKEDGNKEVKNSETNKFSQGRAVVGARFQQQANQWNNQYHTKQSGRPIVKANSMYNNGPDQFFNSQQSQQFLYNQHQPRQQQNITQQQTGGGSAQYGSQSQQKPVQQSQASVGNIGQYSSQSNQQLPQLTQQQLRAQHQQQARPAGSNQPPIQQQQTQQKSQNFPQPQQPQHQQSTAWQQFLNAAAQQGSRNQTGCDGDGDLSPTTTNQLARWFSSDLLERARIGELPSTAGLAAHAVSLEEIERQPAPPVHN